MSVMNSRSRVVGRALVTGGAWLVIAASTALGADCWSSRDTICCRTYSILCSQKQGTQNIIWACPQTSNKPGGFTATSIVPAGPKVNGKVGVSDPKLEGVCKVTTTKCGEFPNECIVTGLVDKQCWSIRPEGQTCTGE